MDVAREIFVALHLAATASILIGWLISFARVRVGLPMMAWAARLQFLIGVVLVNLTFAEGINYAKLVVKILLALVVVGLAEVANARSKRDQPAPALAAVAAALTVVIAALSLLWH